LVSSVSSFRKSTLSTSLLDNKASFTDGAGVQLNSPAGNTHIYFGKKNNNESSLPSAVIEGRYTSPEIQPGTKIQLNQRCTFNDKGVNSSTRVMGTYSHNFDKVNVYQQTGINVSADKSGVTGVGPISFTGVGYQVNKNLNVFAELGVSKGYNPQIAQWGKTNAEATVGLNCKF